MSSIEKAALVFGLILLCGGGLMIARPHEAIVSVNSAQTGYGGEGGIFYVTTSGMRIVGGLAASLGMGFIIAARFGTGRRRY